MPVDRSAAGPWLTVGQQTWLDLSAIARPGSIQESLLAGMLGIRASLPVVEVVAYLLYAIPMLLAVLWLPKRTPSRQVLGRVLVGTAGGSLVIAGPLVALGQAAPTTMTGAQGPFAMQGAATGEISGTAEVTLSVDGAMLDSGPAGSISATVLT